MSRATLAILVCVLSIASLNYFQAPRNRIVFWVAQITFLTTTFRYLGCVLIMARAVKGDSAGEQGLAAYSTDDRIVGYLLVFLDLVTVLGSVVACCSIVFNLQKKLTRVRTKIKTDGNESKMAPSNMSLPVPAAVVAPQQAMANLKDWEIEGLSSGQPGHAQPQSTTTDLKDWKVLPTSREETSPPELSLRLPPHTHESSSAHPPLRKADI